MPDIVDILLDTAEKDIKQQQLFKQEGDNNNAFRAVDFIFMTEIEAKADGLTRFINDNNYAQANYSAENEFFVVNAVVNIPLKEHCLNSISGLMASLSVIFSVTYDGWGASVEN